MNSKQRRRRAHDKLMWRRAFQKQMQRIAPELVKLMLLGFPEPRAWFLLKESPP